MYATDSARLDWPVGRRRAPVRVDDASGRPVDRWPDPAWPDARCMRQMRTWAARLPPGFWPTATVCVSGRR